MFVPVDQINESEERYRSFKKLSPPKHKAIAVKELLIESSGTDLLNVETHKEAKEKLTRRKEMLKAVGHEPVDFAFERAIGNNDSVYSNFCELLSEAKQKICRIVIKTDNRNIGFATGFMVSERLMLTNWHVFETKAAVADSEVEFNYELDTQGRAKQPVIFKLNSLDFFYSKKELDYCLVAVDPVDVTDTTSLSTFGHLFLDPTTGKLGEEGIELLNIIHHPDGDYKQLSIRENRFIKLLPDTLWYETDTAPGSSGSPVFNDQWQVVALHHMGVPAKTADGNNYLDKNGLIIEPVNGKIDISKIFWIANEGIRISVLVKDVIENHPDSAFIKGLQNSFFKPAKVLDTDGGDRLNSNLNQFTKGHVLADSKENNVQISVPASLIESSGSLSIIINTIQTKIEPFGNPSFTTNTVQEDFLAEIARIDRENAVDYSNCKGYLPDFLGVHIPMPKPGKSLLKLTAKKKNSNNYILKYHHFSVIFHSVRRMPVISASNVDGRSKKRLDTTDRVDIWLRDNRIDYEVQLTDNYYALSGFDRGHMSRREDANWGASAQLAKLYADLTCVYTNACPQVPGMNRSNRSGLWGKLENVILEKGVEDENGKSSKISVFNGPVFSDTDPVFKGIRVPMEFWKLILWYNTIGDLNATAFKLSQSGLVDDINFEELDFDDDPEFQQYQISIAALQSMTNLDFSHLQQYDTFALNNPGEALKIDSEEDFKYFVNETFAGNNK